MTPPRETVCDWCELAIDGTERPVRLANSQPPWTLRAGRSALSAISFSISAAIRALDDEPEIELWFHRACWDKFRKLLQGARG